MRARLSARGWVYVTVAVVAPFAALALGDPAPVLVVAPMVVVLVLDSMTPNLAPASVDVATNAERTVEGGVVEVSVAVSGRGTVAHVRLRLPALARIVAVEGAERSGRS
ncbi:MAG: hypothetical protein WB239_15230, partial [Acidimicrobiia bacterium]